LYIDDHAVISNDGEHSERSESGIVHLSQGLHQIKIQYYQGPRFGVALVLEVSVDKETYKVFKISEFIPAKVVKSKKEHRLYLVMIVYSILIGQR